MDLNIMDLICKKKAGNCKSHLFTEAQGAEPFIKSEPLVAINKIFMKRLI